MLVDHPANQVSRTVARVRAWADARECLSRLCGAGVRAGLKSSYPVQRDERAGQSANEALPEHPSCPPS